MVDLATVTLETPLPLDDCLEERILRASPVVVHRTIRIDTS